MSRGESDEPRPDVPSPTSPPATGTLLLLSIGGWQGLHAEFWIYPKLPESTKRGILDLVVKEEDLTSSVAVDIAARMSFDT